MIVRRNEGHWTVLIATVVALAGLALMNGTLLGADENDHDIPAPTPNFGGVIPQIVDESPVAPRSFESTPANKPIGQEGPAAAWVVIPGGIADAQGKVAYVTGASDTLEAVDMVSGETLWECKQARRAVALDGARLIAQSVRRGNQVNVMHLVVVDTAKGQVNSLFKPVVFSEWVAVEGGLGLTFTSVAAIEGRELVLTWQAARQFVGAGAKSPEAVAAARRTDTGTARVDLDQGTSTVSVDDIPKNVKPPRTLPHYDVADKRLSISDSTENVSGGVKIVRRQLIARERKTGKPMWRHEIAGDVILPSVPAAVEKAASKQSKQPMPRR